MANNQYPSLLGDAAEFGYVADPRPPIKEDVAGAAGLLDVAVASLARDPQARIGYYSRQMGIPPEQFGVQGGQIFYETPEGRQAVEPGIARGIARGVGESFAPVGGAIGAIAGLPTAVGSLGLGTVGAGAGEALRQSLALGVMGEPISPMRVAGEAAIDAGSTLAGLLVGKGVSRAAATRYGSMLRSEMGKRGGQIAEALKFTLDDLNTRYGTDIRLTPGELTNSAILRSQQMALGADPRTGERLAQFYATRGQELEKAQAGLMEEIAPGFLGREEAGQQLAKVSDQAFNVIRRERSTVAAPYYSKAFEAGRSVDISGFDAQVRQLAEDFPPLAGALTKLRKDYEKMGEISLENVQNVIKEPLDDLISGMYRKGRNKAGNRLKELQNSLLASMDEQVPQYAKAREIWGDLSGDVDIAIGGALPRLAKTESRDFYDVGRRFLTSSDPATIKRARDAILKIPGGKEKWDNAVRGALEGVWESSMREFKSGVSRADTQAAVGALSYWAKLMGNKEQAARLKAALDPDQFRALSNFLKVAEATGRALNFNSTTVGQGLGREALEQSVGAQGGAIALMLAPHRIPGAASEAASRGIRNANLDLLADAITRTDSVDELLKLSVGAGGRWYNPRNVMIVSKVVNTGLQSTAFQPQLRDTDTQQQDFSDVEDVPPPQSGRKFKSLF